MARLKWSKIEGEKVSTLVLGNLYFFEYKTFNSENYFDAFPLIFLLSKRRRNEEGKRYFEGINFHYFEPDIRIQMFRSMSRFFTNNILIDEDEEDDEKSDKELEKTQSLLVNKLKDEEKNNMQILMEKIPDDTILRAREFRKVLFTAKKYRASKIAFRRYDFNNIQSGILKVLPKQWYEALNEKTQRFFSKDFDKIRSQRIWRESLIRLRRT